jgi:hypothetical protein
MPTSITINNITGSSPYDVYLSQVDQSSFYYIEQIESGDLPHTFIVPTLLQNSKQYCLRVEDSDGCIITNCFSIT